MPSVLNNPGETDLERRRGGIPCPLELRGMPDRDQCVRLRVRQRPDHYSVDDAEDRRGCADAEGQRSHGRKSEAHVPAEHAGRESEIGHQLFKPTDAVHLIDLLPNQDSAPQLPPCSRVCRLGRLARAHVSVDEQLEMGLELTPGFFVKTLA